MHLSLNFAYLFVENRLYLALDLADKILDRRTFLSMFSTEFSLRVGVFTDLLTLVKSGLHFVLENSVKHPKTFKVNS